MGEEREWALYAKDELGKGDMADHIVLLRAFHGFEKALNKGQQSVEEYCRKMFLLPQNMFMIRGIRFNSNFEYISCNSLFSCF